MNCVGCHVPLVTCTHQQEHIRACRGWVHSHDGRHKCGTGVWIDGGPYPEATP